ncbi:MAG: heparinase II/III family protein [Bacteroidales bacterium]|nr:heparinase II/III family protein [Bacteroidales bacterium]
MKRFLAILIIALAGILSCGKDGHGSKTAGAQVLSAPALSIEGNSVSWYPVPNASVYQVDIEGYASRQVQSCYANIGEIAGIGRFNVRVKALGNSRLFQDSEWSESISINIERYSVPLSGPDDLSSIASHPRLFLKAGEEVLVEQLLQKSGNAYLRTAHNHIISGAEEIFQKGVITRNWNGSMLNVAREALRRIFFLSYAYRTSGQEKYAERAWKEMESLGSFDDWNPSHYLDVAEASLAMAIGYDWCYSYLTPSRQKAIYDALYEHSLIYPVSNYGRSTNNWNPVCIGSSLCAAIAVFERDTDNCSTLIRDGIEYLQRGLDCYGPDGAYPEGYSYWGYGTSYETAVSDAFLTAFGKDIGLHRSSGFLRSAEYRLFCNTPAHANFAYSDAGTSAVVCSTLAWFASFLGKPYLMWETKRMLDDRVLYFEGEDRFLPMLLVRLAKSDLGTIRVPDSNIFVGKGEMPVFIYRQGWSNKEDAYLGVKGGRPTITHAHMDEGMFFYEYKGVVWAGDCGSQSYGAVQDMLSDTSQDGQRWKLFRYGCAGHNILQFGSNNQKVDGNATIDEVWDEDGRKGCIVNLDDIYSESAESVRREVWLDAGMVLHVVDKIRGVKADETLHWNMVSHSEGRTQASKGIVFVSGDKQAELSCNIQDAVPYCLSATTGNSYDPANPGYVRAGFNIEVKRGQDYTIEVELKIK